MKPKFTEYERRQIQAMMRQQMPNRKNLVLGSDGMIYWDNDDGRRVNMIFDLHSITAAACCRWQAESRVSVGYGEIFKSSKRENIAKRVDRWRFNTEIKKIVVLDCLKRKQYVIENTLPNGTQVLHIVDSIDTEYRINGQQLGELMNIVGGWNPKVWDTCCWGAKYNRMKRLWRETAKIIGQFEMAQKGYDIFKMYGFDGHFVGFTEK